jgi:prepilin peptidase CpaA
VIWHWVSVGVLAAVLIAAAVTDLRQGKVPNWLTYPAIVFGLALSVIAGWRLGYAGEAFSTHVLGLLFGFGVLFAAYVLGGMGGGDVKLMAAVGAFLGWPVVVHAIVYSFLVAAAIGLILMVWRGRTRVVLRRLWVALRILPLPTAKMNEAVPEDTLRVPFGFAACIAVMGLLVEKFFDGTLTDTVAGPGGLTRLTDKVMRAFT